MRINFVVIPAKATAMAAPWHPAIAAFVHPCTSDGGNAKGLQEQSSPRNDDDNVPLKAAAQTGCRIRHPGLDPGPA
jgi:hypothetical protein